MIKSGLLLIDKPQMFTSYDVVEIVRKKLNIKKAGHSGTLDPLATGLLIILLNQATKKFNYFMNFDKEYTASLRLGVATDSGDSQGKVTKNASYEQVTETEVLGVLEGMKGEVENIPPMVSALRHKGKRLYQLAKKGITIERKARLVNIYKLNLLKFSLPDIEFEIRCSKGTYIRSLGEEIARRLNSVGHIYSICRTAIGPYSLTEAKKVDSFNEDDIRPF